jgi:hypothetical protein
MKARLIARFYGGSYVYQQLSRNTWGCQAVV